MKNMSTQPWLLLLLQSHNYPTDFGNLTQHKCAPVLPYQKLGSFTPHCLPGRPTEAPPLLKYQVWRRGDAINMPEPTEPQRLFSGHKGMTYFPARSIDTHTQIHIPIYLYIYIYVCVVLIRCCPCFGSPFFLLVVPPHIEVLTSLSIYGQGTHPYLNWCRLHYKHRTAGR